MQEIASRERTHDIELWSVVLFLLIFWLFNVVTATRYPFPHQDEAMFVTPAIRYLAGKGFNIPFSEMVSLYCFFLVPWIKLFGHSLRAVRAAEVTWITAAFFILWSAVRRLGLIEQPLQRVLMLLLLATEFGVIVAYRLGRYDGVGFVIMACTLWSISIASQRNRLTFLFFIYLFVPWAGLQYLPLEFTIAVVTVLSFRLRFWKEVAVSFVASGIGAALFLLGLKFSGRLPGFMQLVHVQRRDFFGNLLHGRFDHHNVIPANYSLPFVLVAAVILLVACRKPEFKRAYRALRFAFTFLICLTILLITTSKFPTYYTYMVTIPLMIGICAGLAVCKGKARMAAAAFCLMSSIVGVGVHLYTYAIDRQDRDHSRLEQFVANTIRADDVVFVEGSGYLETVGRAREAYMPLADWDIIERMSVEQRNSVNVLLVHRAWVDKATREFGGEWKATGEELKSKGHLLMDGKVNLGYLSIPDNDLIVFRRPR